MARAALPWWATRIAPFRNGKRNGKWWRRQAPAPTGTLLEARVILRQRRLQLVEDRVGIAAGLLHVGGPFLLERLGGLFPLGQLVVADLVDLLIGLGLQLFQAGRLEIGPWIGKACGPFAGAVRIDDLFLRVRHRRVSRRRHE